MTTISATSVLASEANGKRIDTLLLRYPRWIHAEGRTHRLLSTAEDEFAEWEPRTPSLMEDPNLSRNAASSRAIPVSKMIDAVLDDPAIPLFWGSNKPGMRAGEECTNLIKSGMECSREEAWINAMCRAIDAARGFAEAGYHKQIVNRLLEPFSHIRVVVTATEWSNFFALRDHSDAEPHIRLLAQCMREAIDGATVQKLRPGEWHLPFVTSEDRADICLRHEEAPDYAFGSACNDDAIKLSVARCASVSYKTVDGFDMTVDRAFSTYNKLLRSNPMHASPFEHVAQADHWIDNRWSFPEQHANFVGWWQYRKMIPNESS